MLLTVKKSVFTFFNVTRIQTTKLNLQCQLTHNLRVLMSSGTGTHVHTRARTHIRTHAHTHARKQTTHSLTYQETNSAGMSDDRLLLPLIFETGLIWKLMLSVFFIFLSCFIYKHYLTSKLGINTLNALFLHTFGGYPLFFCRRPRIGPCFKCVYTYSCFTIRRQAPLRLH